MPTRDHDPVLQPSNKVIENVVFVDSIELFVANTSFEQFEEVNVLRRVGVYGWMYLRFPKAKLCLSHSVSYKDSEPTSHYKRSWQFPAPAIGDDLSSAF